MAIQTLKKKISSKIEGNTETIVFEIHAIDNFLSAEELQTICDIHGDDCEAAYDYGVAFDFNDDLTWINCDSFVSWATDYLADNADEDSRGAEYDIIKGIKEKMEKYVAFDLWF